MLCECYEILLPLHYNDGTPVELEQFQETRRALVARFGALTMDAPPTSGLWVSGGREYHDELIRFVVDAEATPETDASCRPDTNQRRPLQSVRGRYNSRSRYSSAADAP